MAGEQSEARFWVQTRASFNAVMAGVKLRRERADEDSLAASHTTAAFGRVKRLDPLEDYLRRLRQARQPRQNPAAMLAVLRGLAASGATKMTVTRRGSDA